MHVRTGNVLKTLGRDSLTASCSREPGPRVFRCVGRPARRVQEPRVMVIWPHRLTHRTAPPVWTGEPRQCLSLVGKLSRLDSQRALAKRVFGAARARRPFSPQFSPGSAEIRHQLPRCFDRVRDRVVSTNALAYSISTRRKHLSKGTPDESNILNLPEVRRRDGSGHCGKSIPIEHFAGWPLDRGHPETFDLVGTKTAQREKADRHWHIPLPIMRFP